MYIFIALVSGLQNLHENDIVHNKIEDYLKIPQNKVVFCDFVYKNVKINYDNDEKIVNFAAQFKEVLKNGEITFEALISKVDDLEDYFGHVEVDAKDEMYHDLEGNYPKIGAKANFYLGETKIVNGTIS